MNCCLIVEDSRLARKELMQMLRETDHFDRILEAADAEAAKVLLESNTFDVLFLDIHLPGMNGFELLEQLDDIPQVIFTTAYDEYAIQSFNYNTIDYLLKPIKQERLNLALEKLMSSKLAVPSNQNQWQKQIFIRDGERCWFVHLSDIRLIESMGNYCRFFFQKEKPLVHKSLNYLEGALNPELFFRANRQQIINLQYIEHVDSWFNGKLKLRLRTGEEVEVSRRQSTKIKELFSL